MAEQTSRFDAIQTVTPAAIWRAVKQRAWIAAVTAVIVGVVYGFYAVKSYRPYYTTSSCFAVSVTNNYGIVTNAYNSSTAEQMALTFPYILQSGSLQELVAADLGYKQLPGAISATAVEETNLFTLTATAWDAQMAYDILQSTIRNYPKVAEPVVGVTSLTLMDEDGLPLEPANSVAWSSVLLVALLAGLVVGVGVVSLYLMLHRTVYQVEDIKKISHVRCVATVPEVGSKNQRIERSRMLLTGRRVPRAFSEAIFSVRTAVERSGKQVVQVTSSLAGEGKSVISVNLAIALAKSGKRVILIDGDMRHPSVAKSLGISKEVCRFGLADYLQKEASVEQIGVTISNLNNLVVIPGGTALKNAAELLDTPRMQELVSIMRQQADYVIVDCPPSAILTDAAVVSKFADGILYVIRQDYSSFNAVMRGVDNVSMGGASLVGFVLNNAKQQTAQYDYYQRA